MARVTAVTAVLAWVNTHPTLKMPGRLDLGAFRTQIRSPSRGAYLWVTRLDGTDALIAEEAADQARIAGVVFAATNEAAEAAAVAYANALDAVRTRTPMGDAVCLVVDGITGPQMLDDQAGERGELYAYQVDADFFLINGGS
ncbi:hypothetical protein AB0K40_17755 [Nonomuraea bangladeshensis]|uniref:Uncharacterized protein n=1 Tax=Nonomuraea bangladeshensis TaxID=404385 RepID=A0ABV3H4B2_9ACTN